MLDTVLVNFSIASGGTASDYVSAGRGYRLVGLIVPALDSTTIGFTWARDSAGTGAQAVFTNTGSPAAATLGSADTGGKAVAVPEDIGRLAAAGYVRLNVAAQNGGARTIVGVFQKQ